MDRFSECSERSISDRFRGVRDGIGDATSEGFKVVKLKLAQPLEDEAVEEPVAADESDLIPPTSSATRVAAALDAAWPDTLLFAVAIGNLATSDVLPFAQRLDLPGPQQRELSARRGEVESMPIRRRLAYGPAPEGRLDTPGQRINIIIRKNPLAHAVFLHDEITQDGVAVRKRKRQVRAGRSWERRAGRIVPQLREALAVHDARGHVDQR